MENDQKEKPKRTRKTADKTPATNDTNGVVDDPKPPQRELAFFTIGTEADRLPPFPDPRGYAIPIGAIADVAYMSGYFGDRTPAQLAIQILVGQSLELSPAVALFDLEIGSGGTVKFKSGQPAQAAGDAAELERQRVKDVLELEDPKPPGSVVEFRPLGEAFQAGPAAEFVVDIENAIKGPLLKTEPETAQDVAGDLNGDSSHESGEAATQSAATGDDDLGFPTDPADSGEMADALSEFSRTGDPIGTIVEPTSPFETKAETVDEEFDRVTAPSVTPDAALAAIGKGAEDLTPAQAETLAGIEVGATITNWRNAIERWIRELEFATDVIVVKLSKFDQATTTEKKTMFDQAKALYETRLSTKRGDVLIALGRDGKTSLDQMAGTFAYYEVPEDPETWTYADAIKAFRTIERETPQLLLDPPKDETKK